MAGQPRGRKPGAGKWRSFWLDLGEVYEWITSMEQYLSIKRAYPSYSSNHPEMARKPIDPPTDKRAVIFNFKNKGETLKDWAAKQGVRL